MSNNTNIREYSTTSEIVKPIIIEPKKIDGVEIDDNLKAPICCIVGHVDAGKTSLLDKLRNSSEQLKEAGGITQHIGSTFFPIESIKESCSAIKGKFEVVHKIPGILMIDTPGHAEFQSLREVGTTICDLGILIIDINASVQEQTKESIKLLKEKNIPFVIAITKLDKVDGWKPTTHTNLKNALKEQTKDITMILESKLEDIKYDLSKEDITAEFYVKNTKPEKVYSMVPISSKTSEGIADLLSLLVFISQTWMLKKLTYKDKIKCTIMETKYDQHLGYTIDVILSNGTLKVGDKFAVATSDGPKISTIRNIMVPSSLTQLGKKTQWTYVDNIKAFKEYPRTTNLDIPHTDIMERIRDSVCMFVGLASYDTFTITSLEALSKGIPLIVTNSKDSHPAQEMVEPEFAKYVYLYKNKTDFLEKVKEFSLMTIEERQALADSAYRVMSKEIFSNRLVELLNKTMEKYNSITRDESFF